ncbi:Small cysteine rich protein [Phytophthora cinnamomi]|uniref:Small cysteine rich protein n=1 Tax=Phytophthora cinnamomi TaxID=4785 RepID=UPI002A34F2B2|nr:Small cysteine rich protein [Phytophthora cinnamomi]KAJ8552167.1 hypothetical protein ON010_g10380 [Phytophthora cinnamomi]
MAPRFVALLLLASYLTATTAEVVRLFGDTNFGLSSGSWLFEFSMAQFCVNTVAFDNKASSAQWGDLPQTGSFPNGQAFIAFYTERNCTGTVRKWPTAEKDFPTNFALNGIDKQISSFMVWKTSSKIAGVAADPTYTV